LGTRHSAKQLSILFAKREVDMSLKNTADIDKPREKLIAKGPASLELEELVAAIIGRGIPGCDAVQIGKKVAKILMSRTYETMVDDLCEVNGMGEAKACQIIAALELARRFPPPVHRFAVIHKAEDVLPFVHQYRYDTQENVVSVTLSGAHEVLKVRLITKGLLNESQIHPREVFAGAIMDRAAAMILVHNHPSGNLHPSRQDLKITKDMQAAGELLGIKLLDHLIVGPKEGFWSIMDEE
jgi:DNA repair protein RadC